MNDKVKTGRIPSLDGWRAISIVLVLLSHEWATSHAPNIPYPWSILFNQGSLGVRIFFVISGYLITHLMLREVELTGRFSVGQFYARRALRILPVYFLYLAVLAVMQGVGLFHDTISSWLGALTFTRNMVGNGLSPTGHLWSLSVEEQFYLAWPITFSALGLFWRRRLAIAVLIAVIALAFIARLIPCSGTSFACERLLGDKSALRFADCLAIGCLGAFVVDMFEQHGRCLCDRHASIVGLMATAALVFSATSFVQTDILGWSLLVTTQALLTIVAIYSTTRGGILAIPLNVTPVIALGVMSYSLYIWHMLFLAHYQPGFGDLIIDDWRLWWLPALVVALASYYFYERRFKALRRKARPTPLPSD
jgi:peptidoglycan/LPS O-acetylase OafA/YrhL